MRLYSVCCDFYVPVPDPPLTTIRMREIADGCNAYMLTDMAHISGLVSAGIIPR